MLETYLENKILILAQSIFPCRTLTIEYSKSFKLGLTAFISYMGMKGNKPILRVWKFRGEQ